MRTGIFGGTFDPPHVGHLILASEALEQLALDQIYWLLTPVSPFKDGQTISPLDARLDMLQAAIADNPQFLLSRVDVDRSPPYYAADSLEFLRKQNPDDELVYLMGADSLQDLPSWHEPLRLISSCTYIGVLRRPGVEVDLDSVLQKLPGLGGKLLWIDATPIPISATRIRDAVRAGKAYRYYVPPAVYEIIRKRKLYLPEDT